MWEGEAGQKLIIIHKVRSSGLNVPGGVNRTLSLIKYTETMVAINISLIHCNTVAYMVIFVQVLNES